MRFRGLAWSPDGRKPWPRRASTTSSSCGTCRVARNGPASPAHTDELNCVAFAPRRAKTLASAGWDQTIRLWESLKGKRAEFSRAIQPCARGELSPAGKLLASCGKGRRRTVVGRRQRRIAGQVEGHTDLVRALAFAPDSKILRPAVGTGRYDFGTSPAERYGQRCGRVGCRSRR